MGVRAGLSEIPHDLFEQIVAGANPTLSDEPRYSLDKAWSNVHAVFQPWGPPLCLAIAGDVLHPQIPHGFEAFLAGDLDYYLGFMSPRLVCDVAAVLATLTVADFARWESRLCGSDDRCGEMYFPNLQQAYTQAAVRQNALMIVIC